jgi:hypothetical protein
MTDTRHLFHQLIHSRNFFLSSATNQQPGGHGVNKAGLFPIVTDFSFQLHDLVRQELLSLFCKWEDLGSNRTVSKNVHLRSDRPQMPTSLPGLNISPQWFTCWKLGPQCGDVER